MVLLDVAAVVLLLFAALAAYDGVYIHLITLRLHARRASYIEHLWHTASAMLFVPIAALLFLEPPHGGALWVGLAAAVTMYVVEAFDVQAERGSRADFGGLARGELAVHFASVSTRTLAIGLVLFSLPSAAWGLGATSTIASSAFAQTVGLVVFWGSVLTATLHVVLAAMHCPLCAPAVDGRAGS